MYKKGIINIRLKKKLIIRKIVSEKCDYNADKTIAYRRKISYPQE